MTLFKPSTSPIGSIDDVLLDVLTREGQPVAVYVSNYVLTGSCVRSVSGWHVSEEDYKKIAAIVSREPGP